ncbi:conserved oligomeric Golgi complex subunit 3 [Tribolium madens]|uniref:conserved oligomeric Golgi complex subunit 3 n=1 Tax=Tribolium madens TaxID=41895 RepID=UPI001CF766CE|nr:conserved oligomeric Golgi complex subunit 3 [Tribolium madens]
MQRTTNPNEDKVDLQIQQNVTNWQSTNNSLAPLSDEQLDIIYQVGDLIKSELAAREPEKEDTDTKDKSEVMPVVDTNRAYINWMISSENEIKHENLKEYQNYYQTLHDQSTRCKKLFSCADETSNLLQDLRSKYLQVTAKTDSLHNLSEQLMTHQRILKEKKKSLNEKLHFFLIFKTTQDNIERYSNKINSQEYVDLLNNIDNAIVYLGEHINFKESRIYKMKYESLLVNALNKIYRAVSTVIVEATKQVLDPDSKTNVVPLHSNSAESMDSAFALYYGKFQSAATKIKLILSHLEEKSTKNEQYQNIISDCQKFYVSQRLPILSTAVSKALAELKEKYRTDYSILFRSCGLFVMKTCQDEANCYHYFFNEYSSEFNDYLRVLCQHLYDALRPSLITINHVEVLSELCGILQKEMLVEKTLNNDHLSKYVEVLQQLLQDAEERLVFRTNIFFQHDLLSYNPSPGDLAYPEKLEQMENITLELQDARTDSRSSVASLESQEVASINSNNPLGHFRSYTGNSPADLHGMWYPTVKRTLVILSRLYFCLDRETFQGLAQEALLICIQTVQQAANLISARKSEIDGRLFQIKHLLIIREQIAPFQVDFTVKEMSLDFSNVQKAAVELLNHRDKLFTFGSNNALLEFLLEGTPRVREYLVDSRKEIDKQLKLSCEAFINCATNSLTGNLQQWRKKVEQVQATNTEENSVIIPQQEFAKAKIIADIISETLKTMKLKVPEIQRSMQLYLANRETEFILFRPIKNNVINVFVQIEQTLATCGYSGEELLLIGCPSPEQINVLICSVSLTAEQDYNMGRQP